MTLDARILGQRVAEARLRAGLTQQALANVVSLDRSALAKVELGERRVSALELTRIAQAVGSRIEWFVEESAPAIVSHRNMAEPGAPSPHIDAEIERRARAVEFVAGLAEKFEPSVPSTRDCPMSGASADALAQVARASLGVASDGPLIGLGELVTNIGVFPFVVDLGPETADAASVVLDAGAVAVINGTLRVGRRRLALAHELGHILVADPYTVDWRVGVELSGERRESLIDRFARALLLPEQSLRTDWEQWGGASPETFRTATVRAASKYQVDMATLARRLLDFGRIDQNEAAQIRSMRTTKADIVELNLVVGDELSVERHSLPSSYAAAVLRLYRSAKISEARALDLLFEAWDASDLPQLARLPEDAIWQFVS